MPDDTQDYKDASTYARPVPEQVVAERRGKSIRTLQRWRSQGYGPAYLRIGGTIHYRMRDVLAFEASMCFGGKGGK